MKKFLVAFMLLMSVGLNAQTLTPLGKIGAIPGQTFTTLPKIAAPYTTVLNRAQVTNFAADLMPKFGVDRIQTQQIMKVDGEQGPNGEPVFKPVNDIHDQVRFVGQWVHVNDGYGIRIQQNPPDAVSYMEVTFYGTGINLLTSTQGINTDVRASVDGLTEGSGGAVSGNIFTAAATQSPILTTRNYPSNSVVTVASGLLAGQHTVRLRNNTASISVYAHGFEIINASPTITLVPGSSYVNGQKITKSVSSTTAFTGSTGWEAQYQNGGTTVTDRTRGGHALIYQKSNGDVVKSVTWTNTAAAYLTSANHANEEIVRTHNYREFGAGRADDFSIAVASGLSLAFTIDDGTTTLVTDGFYNPAGLGTNNTGKFFTLTFVGTGLDILNVGYVTATQSTVYIDGASVGVISSSTSTNTIKIASGLPYGTHTVKFAAVNGNGAVPVKDFIIYAPKTPTLPTGAVALADYFVMADYAANTVSGLGTIGTGVLRKYSTRENVYAGTWTIGATPDTANFMSGWNIQTVVSGSSASYTFFGTGFEFRATGTATAGTSTVLVDGSSNFAASNSSPASGAGWASTTSSFYGTGVTFNSSTGALSLTTGTNLPGCGVRISGMNLGYHTVKVTSTNTGSLFPDAFDIITPIHAPKLNGPFVVQNTLSIGSQSIRDLRQFSVAQGGQQKMACQASGINTGAYTLTSYNPGNDLSCTIKTTGNPIQVNFAVQSTHSVVTTGAFFAIYVDGAAASFGKGGGIPTGGIMFSDSVIVPVSAGYHKVDVYVYTAAATLTISDARKILTVRELGN